MNEYKYRISEEIKRYTPQNGIEICLFGIMLVLAGVGYSGQRWAEVIYLCVVTIMTCTFIYTCLIEKWKVDPSAIYYSIYFLNLLVCVAFAWWWIAVCWGIILVCAGIGMDRYLKIEEKEKSENKK